MKDLHYQHKAVDELVSKTIGLLGLRGNRHSLIFKAPTGSGKTVMASEMLMRLSRELAERPDAPCSEVAYIWIAPNKLHAQSYLKMRKYFSESCALRAVFYDELDHSADGYLRPGEVLFVNWESVNKESNIMVRETENSASLYEITSRTQEDNGIPIVILIDEEHRFGKATAKQSEKVLAKIQPKVEIRISATPDPRPCQMVEVFRQDVIEEEMIKQNIILNPGLDFKAPQGSLNQHLIWQALKKREELAKAYSDLGVKINPLLLIQLPNDNSENLTHDDAKVKNEVIATLDACGISATNGKLAIWLSGEKTPNLDVIDKPNDPTQVLLFKEAIALGWDCPRAAVLLIFRKLGSFQFSAQIVGRILRMPEQKHYTDQRLNQGYVFTNLSNDIIDVVKEDMDYVSAKRMAHRREGLNNIALDSEYRERAPHERNRLGSDFKDTLIEAFEADWNLTNAKKSLFTKEMLFGDGNADANGEEDTQCGPYKNRRAAIASSNINWNVEHLSLDIAKDLELTGEVGQHIAKSKASYVNNDSDISGMFLDFCKHLLGNDYEQRVVKTLAGVIKETINELFEVSEYDAMSIILYDEELNHNRPKFERVIKKAIDNYTSLLRHRQALANSRAIRHYDWSVPEERAYPIAAFNEKPAIEHHALFPFMEYEEARNPEKRFAAFLEENSNAIDWWYKNGDKGKEHYAISYTNKSGEKSLFYVDFIIRMKNGEIFLFDTKTEDSEPDAPYKHNALIDYLNLPENKDRRLRGGGIILEDKFGNWIYSPNPLDPEIGTRDTTNWIIFDPQTHI